MLIEIKYEIGQIVYLKTDEDQKERMVMGARVLPGHIMYTLTCGTQETDHYDIEISEQIDESKLLDHE